ncbi:diphthamide synthesis protein [Candidatus Woesearchaeota archaeon]|nr:diphthamide synthesis protein [Candidatus Woesearchaeota archaeon]
MQYNLELDKAVKEIKSSKAKTVCIQLPDGLKPKANEIADYLEKNTNAQILIYSGSCFGACDVPNVNVDLLIQWGHSEFKK